MTKFIRASLGSLSLVGLLLLAGCATQSEIDTLRADIVKAQETAQSAEQKATQAEIAAKAAAEKADRIYRESLRK